MNSEKDYINILSEVVKKQLAILGPQISLARARSVPGLVVLDDGTVTSFQGSPQIVMQNLVDRFMELSGLIVKKTMEPLLEIYPTTNTQMNQNNSDGF